METPQGRVLSVHFEDTPPHAVVEVVGSLRCARCASGKGCGAGILGGDERPRRVDAMLAPGLQVQAGDQVRISMAPDKLLRASMLVYGLPLAGAVTGAAVALLAGAGDPGAAITVFIGAAAGVVAGRQRLRRAACLDRFTPTVTARLLAAAGD